jgi:hypothetical protein
VGIVVGVVADDGLVFDRRAEFVLVQHGLKGEDFSSWGRINMIFSEKPPPAAFHTP